MNRPPRIVSLISSATEMLFALELGEQVVGVSHECDWPPEVNRLPRLTRSLVDAGRTSRDIDDQVQSLAAAGAALYEIDTPGLEALAPDLIVTQAQCDVCAVRYADVLDAVASSPRLRGARVLALNPESIGDVLADIARLGSAAGADDAASRLVASLQARVDHVRRVTASIPAAQRPRVLCLEWIEPPMAAGNWMPELVAWAGGENGLSVAGRHSGYTTWADVVAFDPEVVLIMPCGFDLGRAEQEAAVLRAAAGWADLAAVKADRVFAADGNAYFNRSGPRLVDSLEILAHLIQPELFPTLPGEGARAAFSAWS